ncbi:hypothetical protein MFRU_018g00590 [Monilinia fructicola]|nr:hypothetical protein MFRU_018g00590 [Monilinia fructicola]
MSRQLTSRWTISERSFFNRICAPLEGKPTISDWAWEEIAETFAIEQARHLPGGDRHYADPWPERSCDGLQCRAIHAFLASMDTRRGIEDWRIEELIRREEWRREEQRRREELAREEERSTLEAAQALMKLSLGPSGVEQWNQRMQPRGSIRSPECPHHPHFYR